MPYSKHSNLGPIMPPLGPEAVDAMLDWIEKLKDEHEATVCGDGRECDVTHIVGGGE